MKTSLLFALALVVTACAGSQAASPAAEPTSPTAEPTSAAVEPTFTVVLASEVEWQHLNPARGDASPRAGTLWGDRNGSGPTGFLLRPADGFESPPHIHNVSYRGLVIRGLIHNDDPNAEEMWLPTGSFWTQPRGEGHITAARGSDTLAYIEIDEGPYLVRPVEEAFQTEERPINVDASNIVWVPASASADGPQVAYLWGNPRDDQPSGLLVQLPAGSAGMMHGHGSTFRAVLIQGRFEHRAPGETDVTTMEPGSFFSSNGGAAHQVSCEAGEDCIIYVRRSGRFDVAPVQPGTLQ